MPDPAPAAGPHLDDGPNANAGWRRISVLRVGVAVLVIAAAVTAWALTRGSTPDYRTSVVRTGTVEATLDPVGTVTPVNQADLDFNVSGKVAAVDVSVGATVSAGQTVASLDPTAFTASVVSAEATLAAAQATLAAAEASQSAAASAPAAGGEPTTTPTTTPVARSGQASPNGREIAQLQAALVADQAGEDADSSVASQSLDVATNLCEAPTATGSPSTTTTTTTPPATGDGGGAPTTCAEALAQASAARDRVTADIKQVTRDESALNAALQATSGPAATGATTSATPSAAAAALTAFPTASATEARTVAFSSTGGGSKSVVATPQQLAVDQAAIDVAQAQLTDAQQALDGVNLVSTISGTVASVTIAAGDSVSAGASSNASEVVVIGPGSSYQLVAQVPVADIVKVAVGQPATVTPDATNDQLEGRVTSIGALPASGSTSTTYPVTIALNSSDLGLFSGADAAAAIVIGRAADVIAVPTSAVRTVGSVHLVTVVTNGTTKTTRVTLGTVGDVLTQITSGVKPGQVVALANLQAPVPTTSTAITRFGGTGLGGGGLGRIGFGAGGGGRFGSGGLGG